MLTLLTIEQVATYWDIIKYGLEQSLPPVVADHPDNLNRVLTSLLSGKSQCWASYIREEGKGIFEGILVTRVLFDDVSNTRNLLLYAIYGYTNINKSTWLDGLKTILKYAIAEKCAQIVAYTSAEYLVNLAASFGADTQYTFVSFNVNKAIQKLNELDGGN